MPNPLETLKNKIFSKKESSNSYLVDIIGLARELKCLPEILGRDFEVYDKDGTLIYTIKQKPITIPQLNILQETISELRKIDKETANKNMPNIKKPKRGR